MAVWPADGVEDWNTLMIAWLNVDHDSDTGLHKTVANGVLWDIDGTDTRVFTKYLTGTLDSLDGERAQGHAHGLVYTNILSVTVAVEEQGQSRFRFMDLKTGTIPSSTTLGIEMYYNASNIIFAGVGTGFEDGDYVIKIEYTE
jgi:hypothetical protein